MNSKSIILVVALIAAAILGYFLFTNADSSDSRQADGSLSISTSFYPLAYAAEEIVGDLGTVTNIGEGRDPHDFRPSVQNIATLQRSDLVVLQGADYETWGDDVIEQLERDDVRVAIATEGLTLMEGGHDHHDHEGENSHGDEDHHDKDTDHQHDDEDHHEDEHDHDHEASEDHGDTDHHDEDSDHDGHDGHDHGAFDPHTWLDPILFGETVEKLVDEIILIDPANADTYRANADDLLERLSAVDGAYREGLTNCALDEVITSHDAFGYLGARYDFEIHSIAGLSTQDSPSSVTLAELREEAEEGIGAILLEENAISAYGETLARETGLQTLPINPISYVIPEGENYITLMEQNLATLRTALECNG
jgi:zinc transport system substrate-binding protein